MDHRNDLTDKVAKRIGASSTRERYPLGSCPGAALLTCPRRPEGAPDSAPVQVAMSSRWTGGT